jgi:hypothetical protein
MRSNPMQSLLMENEMKELLQEAASLLRRLIPFSYDEIKAIQKAADDYHYITKISGPVQSVSCAELDMQDYFGVRK